MTLSGSAARPHEHADAYTYVAPPTVTAVSPSPGPTAWTSLAITGTGFARGRRPFGTTAGASVTVNSATSITAVAPAGSAARSTDGERGRWNVGYGQR